MAVQQRGPGKEVTVGRRRGGGGKRIFVSLIISQPRRTTPTGRGGGGGGRVTEGGQEKGEAPLPPCRSFLRLDL